MFLSVLNRAPGAARPEGHGLQVRLRARVLPGHGGRRARRLQQLLLPRRAQHGRQVNKDDSRVKSSRVYSSGRQLVEKVL